MMDDGIKVHRLRSTSLPRMAMARPTCCGGSTILFVVLAEYISLPLVSWLSCWSERVLFTTVA